MIKGQDNTSEITVGHIIARDYRKSQALVFRGVDFSCGGNRTLDDVFNGKEEELHYVLQEWGKLDAHPPEKEVNFVGRDMAFLTDYIIKLHHHFVNSQTTFITELAYKVAESNHERNPEIKAIAELFESTGMRLEIKGRQEEKELFPYLLRMHEAMSKGIHIKAASFGPVGAIKTEGEQIVAALGQMRQLTNNYTAPAYTTSTCPILYKLLAEYEADTLLHLHLENNILFPRALQTEDYLRANQQIN
ncbi:MAG: hemerythrin domain-containing protein [Bacteroidota bacterium]